MTGRVFRFTIAASAGLGVALTSARPDEPKPTEPPAFRPQISDFMSDTQRRHFKLGLSGGLSNWPLAAYELGKLKESPIWRASSAQMPTRNFPISPRPAQTPRSQTWSRPSRTKTSQPSWPASIV
jgi:hypothetical protein